MDITFLGHASVKIDDLIVDPWTKEIEGFGLKPLHAYTAKDRKCKFICITHNHPDHRLGAEDLAKENNATIIAGFELAGEFMGKGLSADMLNIGGSVEQGDWKIHMTQAWHSASSNPSGFILQKKGKTFFHAGDTGLFDDLKRIGTDFSIDVAFLPIGGRFTMGPGEALAAAAMLKPKLVIPIHYNTFDMIKVDEKSFARKATDKKSDAKF